LRLERLRPDLVRAADVAEHAAVARLAGPAPLDLQHVVAVVLLGDDVAVRPALAVDDAVLDAPDVLRLGLALVARVDEGLPTGQVLAVEQLDRLALFRPGRRQGQAGQQGRRQPGEGEGAAIPHGSVSLWLGSRTRDDCSGGPGRGKPLRDR